MNINTTAGATQRVVIIGGGVAGLSIAAHLAKAGLPVTLLEASKFGAAASTRNQGWLYSGGWFAPAYPELARLCYRSLEQTLRFCPDCIEPNHQGMDYVFSQPDTSTAEWTTAWERAQIPYTELSPNELFEHVPGFEQSAVQRAFLLPDRAFRPDVLLQHLAAAAENAGAELRSETMIHRIVHEGRQVRAVVTGRSEEIPARFVILATGASGAQLWPQVLDQQPGRQAYDDRVFLKTHLVSVQPELARRPFLVVDAQGFNHIPHPENSVFGFDRWHPVSAPAPHPVDTEEIDCLWGYVERFFPEFQRANYETLEWAGVTLQAMRYDQIQPGEVPLPMVIDHTFETPSLENLLTVFPGRASLWAHLAERTCQVVLQKLAVEPQPTARPPWSV
jgi:glycine/D-amino acid oxidase-like deaminating enzyme